MDFRYCQVSVGFAINSSTLCFLNEIFSPTPQGCQTNFLLSWKVFVTGYLVMTKSLDSRTLPSFEVCSEQNLCKNVRPKIFFSIVYVFFNPVFCNVVSRIEAKVFLKCRKLNHLSFWSRNICPTSSQRLARLSLLTVNCTKVWKKSISESSNMPYE